VPAWRWGVWLFFLALAVPVFYVVLTPIWLGLRGLAWIVDRRAKS